MKKTMLGLIGLSGILAACGSSGIAPDGSGSGSITALRTEYAISSSPTQYAGCDTITNPTEATRGSSTQVAVDFTAAGSIQSVEVSLKGVTTSVYDPNFVQTIPASNLTKKADGSYTVLFDANSSTGKLLPNAIVVSPVVQPVKTVTGANKVEGGFYTTLKINTATSTFTLTSRNLTVIPVYRSCTIQNTAQPLSY